MTEFDPFLTFIVYYEHLQNRQFFVKFDTFIRGPLPPGYAGFFSPVIGGFFSPVIGGFFGQNLMVFTLFLGSTIRGKYVKFVKKLKLMQGGHAYFSGLREKPSNSKKN